MTLNPIPFVKEISVSADIAAEEIDAEKGIIPGTLHTVTEDGEKTVDATGTATVGEKAKGPATFVNCDSSVVSFSAGTQIKVAGKSLVYTIDSNVSDVPARVADICGSKAGSITASSIGSDYNQGESVYFDFVSGYSNSDYDVYTDTGQSISEGSAEEVTIVAADDQSNILEDLKKDLVKEGKETITGEGGLDEVIVEKAIKSEVTKKTFSHAVGEQTDKLTLNLTMKFTIITYSGASMQDLISQTIGTLVPEGFTLFPGETNVEPLDPKLSKNKLSFQAKVSSDVVPEIDTEKIKNDLTGRNPASAQEYLSSLGEVNAYEIKIWPNLPESFQRVPRNTDRITITLKTEEL